MKEMNEMRNMMDADFDAWFSAEKDSMERANPDHTTRLALTSFSKLAFFAGFVAAARLLEKKFTPNLPTP